MRSNGLDERTEKADDQLLKSQKRAGEDTCCPRPAVLGSPKYSSHPHRGVGEGDTAGD